MAKKIRIQAELDDSKLRKQLDDIGKRKEKITVDVDSRNIDNTDQSMKRLNRTASDSNSVFSKLKNTVSNTFSSGKLAMTGYLMVLNEINKAARHAKITINDMDESVTNLSIAMGKGRNEAYGYLGELNKQAKVLGATTKETADSADSWIRQGKSIAETEKLVRDSMVLSKLGKIESADASEYLTASLNGYKKSASEAIDIVDKLTSVDMESASDAGGLAVSLSKTASAANMAGVSFDRLVGMVATVKEVTQDSDESVGNMFKSVFSRMNQIKAGKFIDAETGEALNDVEKVLNKVGIAIRDANGEFISSEKIMDDVGSKWESFDSTTQRAVATAMAGTYQYNKLIALFENYSKALQYTEVAADSAGTAMQKFNDSYLGSLEAKQNTLQASFESMIINTDFSEVYSGILDATTALIDFINQTNALKGVLAGLTVAGGIKAFLTIKTGVTEAYIALNKFQNALDLSKSSNISTQGFERLLLLSNGLSTSQMKLVLSTNNLSVAQKQQLLIANGLSEQEAVLQLETWGMTAANTGLTAATTTLGNAFKGLWATLVANPLIVVTAAISAAVMAYQSYDQKLDETRQKNIESATTASESVDKLKDLYNEYNRLASIQDRTTSEEEAFKTAVENITVALGNKAEILKDITAGTNEYSDALARATKEELQSQAVTATIGRKASEEEFQDKIWSDWSGSQVTIDSNSKGKSLSDEAQKAVDIVSDSLKEYEGINRTWKNISWDISSDNPTEALEYYNALIEAREKLVIASGDDEALLDTEIYIDLNNAINAMTESLDTYIERLYEEQKMSYMVQNGIPTTTEEYKAMEIALGNAAGASEGLKVRFEELLTEDFSSLATNVEKVGEAVSSMAGQMSSVPNTLSISQTVDQLNTQIKPAFDSLKSAWQDIFTDDGFALNSIDILSTCDSIKSKLDEMSEIGLNVDYSAFEDFVTVLSNTKSTEQDVENAFDSLATSITNAGLSGTEDFETMKAALEDLGVVNSEMVAFDNLISKTNALADAGIDLANATEAEMQAFVNESVSAENAGEALALLQLKKALINQTTITTAADCQNILELAQAANVGIAYLNQLNTLMNLITQRDSAHASGDSRAVSELNRAIRDFSANVVNNLKLDDVKVDFGQIGGGKSSAKSAGKDAGKSYKDGLKEELSDLDSVISGITGRIDDQIGSINEQKSAALDSIDAQKEALEEAKDAAIEAIEQERQARLDAIEEQRKALESQIKEKQKIIDGIQDEIKAMQDANEERKREIDLQKAKYELERMQNQRTKLVNNMPDTIVI